MNAQFTSLYTHTRERSRAFSTVNDEESMTQQDDAKDADINVIVSRFIKSGQLPQMIQPALSGDFTNALDFRECQDKLTAANQAFAEIPAKIRARFSNDPAQFIEFASNPENLEELRKMGLAPPPAPAPTKPPPMEVIITNPQVTP